jgi:hypothetical protein
MSGVGVLLLLPNNGIVDELKDRRHDLWSCRPPPRRLPPSLLPGCDDVDEDNIADLRHDNDADNPPPPPPLPPPVVVVAAVVLSTTLLPTKTLPSPECSFSQSYADVSLVVVVVVVFVAFHVDLGLRLRIPTDVVVVVEATLTPPPPPKSAVAAPLVLLRSSVKFNRFNSSHS